MNPKTLDEWAAYVASIPVEDLFHVGAAAGTTKFMCKLLEEGYTADEITSIHRMFASRFTEVGIEPPSGMGCVVDYRRITNPHP